MGKRRILKCVVGLVVTGWAIHDIWGWSAVILVVGVGIIVDAAYAERGAGVRE